MPTPKPRQIDPNLDQSIEERGDTPEAVREDQIESANTHNEGEAPLDPSDDPKV